MVEMEPPVPSGDPDSGRLTPFGRPVVPEE